MTATDRRAYAYQLGRFTTSCVVMDFRAAYEPLADRRVRCERYRLKMKTWRVDFRARLARMLTWPW